MQYIAAIRCTYIHIDQERGGAPNSQADVMLARVFTDLLEDIYDRVRSCFTVCLLFGVIPSLGVPCYVR